MTENLINLEDDSAPPPVAPPVVPQAVVPEPPPAEPVVEDPDDAEAIDTPNGRVVPLQALKATRQQLKQANQTLAQVPQLQQQLAQLQGQLQTFQSLQQTLQAPPAPQHQAPAPEDPRLVELARSLDYYKQDGSPDIARAVKHANIMRQYVTEGTQEALQPMQQTLHQQKSTANFYAVVNQATARGIQVDQQNLWNIWQTLPHAVTADAGAAFTVLTSALGAQMMTKPQQPAPPGRSPLVTEPLGNTPPRPGPPLTAQSRAVIQGRMDEKKYTDLTKDFKPGRTNILEDD